MGYTSIGATAPGYPSSVNACLPSRDREHCVGTTCSPLYFEKDLDAIQCMYNKAVQKFGSIQSIYAQAQQASVAFQQVIPTSVARGMTNLANRQRVLAATSRSLVSSIGRTMEQWGRVLPAMDRWIRGERSMMSELAPYRYLFAKKEWEYEGEAGIHEEYSSRLLSHKRFLPVAADSLKLLDAEERVLKGLQKHLGTAYLQSEANVNSLTLGWKSTLDSWKAEQRAKSGVMQKLANMLGIGDLWSSLATVGIIVGLGFAAFMLVPPLLRKAAKKIEG